MRLFIGISPPDHISSHLSTMRGSLPLVHWNSPDTYHITLCYIGEIKDYNQINDLNLALEKINFSSFELTIQGVSHFTSPTCKNSFSATIISTPSLLQLKKKIEHVCHQFHIKPNKQRFAPHITLATGAGINEEQISNWLYRYNLFKTEPFQVCQFSLFSSYPGGNEAYYTVESNYSLQ